MAISHTCTCGASIRLPAAAAGRRARCKSCGAVFTVPADSTVAADTTAPPAPGTDSDSTSSPEQPGAWLEEFSRAESQAVGDPVVLYRPSRPELPPEEDLQPPELRHEVTGPPMESPDEDREWITGPELPFWQDLAESFVFFLDAGNLVTLMVLCFISFWSVLLGYATIIGVGLLGQIIIGGYFCAFYQSVIVDTASGENELPNIWFSSVFEDLFLPLVRFVGTFALALLPATSLLIYTWWYGPRIPWTAVYLLGGLGLFFWPIIILGAAIGGSFRGMWPHLIIRTALAAPLPYLAVWAALLVAAGFKILPQTSAFAALAATYLPSSELPLLVVNTVLSTYASIVAMRVIGLFYRHYKKRFPWVAE